MKKYQRTLHRYSLTTREESVIVESYTQPKGDRFRYLSFLGFFKFTNLKGVHWLIDGPLERLHERWHGRGCAQDCTVAQVRSSIEEPWREERVCGLLPLCAQLDLKLYDLDTRNNQRVSQ